MVILNSGFNWDPDTFNGASFLGGAGAMLVFLALILGVWKFMIQPQVEDYRLRKEAEYELQLDQMRTEIRMAVLQELENGEQEQEQAQQDE